MSVAAVSPGSAMATGVGELQPHLILVAALHEKRLWLQRPWIKPPVSPWTSRQPKQLCEDVPRAECFTASELLCCHFCIILRQNSPSSESSSPTETLASSFYPAWASCSLLQGAEIIVPMGTALAKASSCSPAPLRPGTGEDSMGLRGFPCPVMAVSS